MREMWNVYCLVAILNMNKFWKSQYNSLDENLHNKSELHSSHERIGVHCYKVYKSWKLINSRVHYLSVRNWTECISHFTPLHFKDYRKFGTEDVSSINSDRWIKHHHEQYNRAISPETKGINWISHVSLFQQRRWTSQMPFMGQDTSGRARIPHSEITHFIAL